MLHKTYPKHSKKKQNVWDEYTLFDKEHPNGAKTPFKQKGNKEGGVNKGGGIYTYKFADGDVRQVLLKQGLQKKSRDTESRNVVGTQAYGETISEFISATMHHALGGDDIKAAKSSLVSIPDEKDGAAVYVSSEYNPHSSKDPLMGFKLVGHKNRPKMAKTLHTRDLITPLENLDKEYDLGLENILASAWLQGDKDIHSGNFVLIIDDSGVNAEYQNSFEVLASYYRNEIKNPSKKPAHFVFISALRDIGAKVYFEKIDHGYGFYHTNYYKNRTPLNFLNRVEPFFRDILHGRARPTDHFTEYSKKLQHKCMELVNGEIRDRFTNGKWKDDLREALDITEKAYGDEAVPALVGYLHFLGNKTVTPKMYNNKTEDLKDEIVSEIEKSIKNRLKQAENSLEKKTVVQKIKGTIGNIARLFNSMVTAMGIKSAEKINVDLGSTLEKTGAVTHSQTLGGHQHLNDWDSESEALEDTNSKKEDCDKEDTNHLRP